MIFSLENNLILLFVQNLCLPVAFNKHQACPCTSCGLTASSDMSVIILLHIVDVFRHQKLQLEC